MPFILIIDDDPQILEIYKKFLENEGHLVVTADDGEEGIAIFRKYRADLVITDIVMSVKDGLKTIMELEKEFPAIRIIAISGGGTIGADRYLNLAEHIGVKQTLSKPISRKQLIDAVNEVLEMP